MTRQQYALPLSRIFWCKSIETASLLWCSPGCCLWGKRDDWRMAAVRPVQHFSVEGAEKIWNFSPRAEGFNESMVMQHPSKWREPSLTKRCPARPGTLCKIEFVTWQGCEIHAVAKALVSILRGLGPASRLTAQTCFVAQIMRIDSNCKHVTARLVPKP